MYNPYSTRISANAKLNLSLKLVGRRSDGYHLLRMVNVALDLADGIEVRPEDPERNSAVQLKSLGLGCSAESAAAISNPEQSSLTRAVRAFNEEFQTTLRPCISIDKRIPAQAGLGGGSADAAAMLRWCRAAMEHGRGRELSKAEQSRFHARALTLGADVPYALTGGCALVEGVGELVTTLPWPVRGTPILLIIPSVGVSTPEAFARVRSLYPELQDAEPRFSQPPQLQSPRVLVTNDLFPIVASLVPAVGEAAATLQKVITTYASQIPGGVGALGMTGSGSTLFIVPEQWGPAPEWHPALAEVIAQHAPALTTIETAII